MNRALVGVDVKSNGPWHLTAAPAASDATRGHMRLTTSQGTVLASAMQVLTGSGQPVDLSVAAPTVLYRGRGSAALRVVFDQTVGPADQPGTYAIQIVFTAISGF